MIREYAPIPLIPAAWTMTFATILYPGIDTYWIQHMHYFMILFLTGFTVLSWKQMSEDQVLDIWRKVIGAGVLFTGLGAFSFTTQTYSTILAWISITYWFLAPGIALYQSSTYMEKYSDLYEKLAIASITAFTLFVAGTLIQSEALTGISLVGIAAAQTVSIVAASKLDN